VAVELNRTFVRAGDPEASAAFLASLLGLEAAPLENRSSERQIPLYRAEPKTGATGLEPAASGVTGRRSNQLSYAPEG
jgi:hypothetical protein